MSEDDCVRYWLGTWNATIDRQTAVWLRFFDSAGNLILLPEAAKEQAEQERQRVDRLAARLRGLKENSSIL